MKVHAKDFHPMRGHVEDGAVVMFSDGSELTLRSSMRGWKLIDQAGVPAFAEEIPSAFELTRLIVERDQA
jgi:hypothetical protein